MLNLTHATGQTAAYFPYAFRLRHLAEEHGDKLFPTTVPLGMLLGAVFSHNGMKSAAVYQR